MTENAINIAVAQTLDDLMKVMVIRGAVFVGEQHHRYNLEFGEGELTRTHLLAQKGNEPIGTMRILKENKDAKFERLAILASYRGKNVSEKIIEKGYEICRESGIAQVCLFCKPHLLGFWEKQGYKKVGGNKALKVENMFLLPIVLNLRPDLGEKEAGYYDKIPDILLKEKGEWVEYQPDALAIILNKKKEYLSGK